MYLCIYMYIPHQYIRKYIVDDVWCRWGGLFNGIVCLKSLKVSVNDSLFDHLFHFKLAPLCCIIHRHRISQTSCNGNVSYGAPTVVIWGFTNHTHRNKHKQIVSTIFARHAVLTVVDYSSFDHSKNSNAPFGVPCKEENDAESLV